MIERQPNHQDIVTQIAVTRERLDTHMEANEEAHDRIEQKVNMVCSRPTAPGRLDNAITGLIVAATTLVGAITSKLYGLW